MVNINKTEEQNPMPDIEPIAKKPEADKPQRVAKSVKAKEPPKVQAEQEEGFCIYLGPSVHGIIQSGTVYKGTKAEAVAAVSGAIEKYPLIERLIVTHKTLPVDRIRVKTPGNALYNYCKRMVSGEKQ